MDKISPKIALFGGTFNPPHMGHIRAFESFCENIKPDTVYVMPASIPPHKEISAADMPCHRYNMARIAFSERYENVKVSALEISRKGKSYSIDTVDRILEETGAEKLYMYIGSDMLFYFEKWKDFEKLFEKCVLVTAARCDEDEKALFECCERYAKEYGCEYILLPLTPFDISSTLLRDMPYSEMGKYLPDEIREYVADNDLYGDNMPKGDITSKETLCKIKKELPLYIDAKRMEHVLSVEETALMMAKIFLPLYDLSDEYLADISAAALLHDITKNKEEKWHEEYLEKRMSASEYYSYSAVYHSWSGAYFALENYFVNPRVFRAIYNHTTANSDMDIFEKIIYLADYIEPTRKYESCILLRTRFKELCEKYSDDSKKLKTVIDTVILESLEGTLSHLSDCGRTVCPALYSARDHLKKGEIV